MWEDGSVGWFVYGCEEVCGGDVEIVCFRGVDVSLSCVKGQGPSPCVPTMLVDARSVIPKC